MDLFCWVVLCIWVAYKLAKYTKKKIKKDTNLKPLYSSQELETPQEFGILADLSHKSRRLNTNMNHELNEYLAIADQEFLDKNIKIDHDEGKLSIHIVRMFENFYNVKLPRLYVRFITQHNGAYIENDSFDYGDTTSSIRFDEFGKMIGFLESIKYDKEHDYDTYPDWHIPFGDDGGEGTLFFNYSQDNNTDDPPITMIAEGDEEIVANNFEEFIKKLYVDPEPLSDQLDQVEKSTNVILPESYKNFCIEYCTKNFHGNFEYKFHDLKFMFPSKISWSVCSWNEKSLKGLIPICFDENNNLFCFSYENSEKKELPIIIRKIENIYNTELIANNFEEFINMIHKTENK